MAEAIKPQHQFIVSNHNGVVIRCCIHCGLSHRMEQNRNAQFSSRRFWKLIIEEDGDVTFAEPCPAESGSDNEFPFHHFILSTHHYQSGSIVVIRFCVHCGLSHLLGSPPTYALTVSGDPVYKYAPRDATCWSLIKDNERDVAISELCRVEPGSDALQQRYVPVR